MEARKFQEPDPVEYDPLLDFIQTIPRMVGQARRAARYEAISYRGVHVGAAIMLSDTETSSGVMLYGSNLKAKPDDEKYCAEMDVIDQAITLGHKKAAGLVIAGPSHPGTVASISGIATPTLHPCDSCQRKMKENPQIIAEDTLIVTVSTEEDVYQVHTADELMMLYETMDTPEVLVLETGTPLNYETWGDRVKLYDDLSKKYPLVQKYKLARIALENVVEVSGMEDC